MPEAKPSPAPSQTTAEPSSTPSETAPKAKTATAAKKPAHMTQRQEIEKSLATGTVPSRYRSQVPKEYQRYIPFAK